MIDFAYAGQYKAARAFILKEKLKTPEELALLGDSSVLEIVNKFAVEKNYDIWTVDGGQDVVLVPFELVEKFIWFSR